MGCRKSVNESSDERGKHQDFSTLLQARPAFTFPNGHHVVAVGAGGEASGETATAGLNSHIAASAVVVGSQGFCCNINS